MLWRTSAGRWRNEQSLFGDIGGLYWWSMQHGVGQRKRASEERQRGRKRVDKLKGRERERRGRSYVSLDLSRNRNSTDWLKGKRHNRERRASERERKNSVKLLFFSSSPKCYARSEWLENIIISANDNATGAKTTTTTTTSVSRALLRTREKESSRESERERERKRAREISFSNFSRFSLLTHQRSKEVISS